MDTEESENELKRKKTDDRDDDLDFIEKRQRFEYTNDDVRKLVNAFIEQKKERLEYIRHMKILEDTVAQEKQLRVNAE